MKEITNVEAKLNNVKNNKNIRRLHAYNYYKKYEAMLNIYNRSKVNGISLTKNLKNPYEYAHHIAEKKGFSTEEYISFCDVLDKLTEKDNDLTLNDLLSKQGREVIGNIIYDVFPEAKNDACFSLADLDSVAIARYYGLCQTLKETEGKSINETFQILMVEQIPPKIYEPARKHLEDYEKTSKKQLYNSIREDNVDDIVHITAGALEIEPEEVEDCLVVFEEIEGISYDNKIDKELKFQGILDVSQAVLDTIDKKDNLSEEEKLILKESIYNKASERYKMIRANIEKWLRTGRKLEDLPEDFMKRNGIVFKEKEINKQKPNNNIETDDLEIA